jgi:hypothetical protein
MIHVAFLAAALLWVLVSVVLWAEKQEQVVLFLESLGLGAIAFIAMYWHFTRAAK